MLQEPLEFPLGKMPVPYRYQIRETSGSARMKRGRSGVDEGHTEDGVTAEDRMVKKLKTGMNVSLSLSDKDLAHSSVVTPTGLASISNSSNSSGVPSGANSVVFNASLLLHEDDALPLSPIPSPGFSVPEKLTNINDEINFDTKLHTTDLVANSRSQLSPTCYKNLMFRLVAKLNRSDLADICTLIKDNLKRDFLTSLPPEISLNILSSLSYEDIIGCLQVSRNWNKLINSTPSIWKGMLISENFVQKDEFKSYSSKLLAKYKNCKVEEDCYRVDFLQNRYFLDNWYNPQFQPKRYTLPSHVTSVVTCLQFEDDYIITGADDKMIRVYEAQKKKFLMELRGHEGGVWALKYIEDGLIVSGSTDRSVRIWDIKLGRCTYVFKGHTSTVRCLEIVEYKGIKYIITGSRDNTLHVWKLPNPKIHRSSKALNKHDISSNMPYTYSTPDENPFFVGILRGHMASVRALSGHGNIVISGSYDNSLMVWDIAQMKCLYVLTGHTDRIYSILYDYKRQRCISASMDATIRVWDLKDIWKNGTCIRIMNSFTPCTNIMGSMLILHGHTALVGLLKLSDKYLVSAAADGSLRGWNADSYGRKFLYHHINMSAITTFDVNDNLLVSGSESQFNIYNLRTGTMVHPNILSDADQIWSVRFKENILVVAIERDGQSFIEIFDFNENTTPDAQSTSEVTEEQVNEIETAQT